MEVTMAAFDISIALASLFVSLLLSFNLGHHLIEKSYSSL